MNNSEISDAFKNNLDKRKAIKEKQGIIQKLYSEMVNNNIPEISKTYSLVFNNINPDKKLICDIDDFHGEDDYYNENDKKRKLFLNRDGFSLSDGFANEVDGKEVDVSRTNYTNKYSPKQFIKILKRLFKNKTEILNAIQREYKKSVATRFFEAFDKSDCDVVFDYEEDFDVFKQDLSKKLSYYDGDVGIDFTKVDYIKYRNASGYIEVNKDKTTTYGYGSRTNIDLTDIEKLSQIYDELMVFLDDYYKHLDVQNKSLQKFDSILKDLFAKELVLNSLKDKKEEK